MTPLPLSDIPQDIMREVSKWTAQCYQPETGTWFDVRDVIAKAILSERQRHAEVMEEVRKVLGNIVTAVEREPVVSNLDYPHAHNDWRGWRKKIMRPAVDEARALLSRLEER